MPNSAQEESGLTSGQSRTTQKNHTKAASPLRIPKGVRGVKAYTILSNELDSIGAACWLGSLFFGLAGGFISFLMGIKWDFAMIVDPSPQQIATKDAVLSFCWTGFAVAVVIGVGVTCWRRNIGSKIRSETDFETDV